MRRTSAIDIFAFVGVVIFWSGWRLADQSAQGHQLSSGMITKSVVVGVLMALVIVGASVVGKHRAGGYHRLSKQERSLVDEALRTGVPTADGRLRRVERDQALRATWLHGWGLALWIVIVVIVSGFILVDAMKGPTWLPVYFGIGMAGFLASVLVEKGRNARPLFNLLAATEDS